MYTSFNLVFLGIYLGNACFNLRCFFFINPCCPFYRVWLGDSDKLLCTEYAHGWCYKCIWSYLSRSYRVLWSKCFTSRLDSFNTNLYAWTSWSVFADGVSREPCSCFFNFTFLWENLFGRITRVKTGEVKIDSLKMRRSQKLKTFFLNVKIGKLTHYGTPPPFIYTYSARLGARSCRLRVQVSSNIHLVLHLPENQTVSLQSRGMTFWINLS